MLLALCIYDDSCLFPKVIMTFAFQLEWTCKKVVLIFNFRYESKWPRSVLKVKKQPLQQVYTSNTWCAFQIRFQAGPHAGEELRAPKVRLRRLLGVRHKARDGAGEPPGGLVHDGPGGRSPSRRRPSAARAGRAGRAGGRHERHAARHLRQHQRPGHHDRRARRRLYQEDVAALSACTH